MNDEFIRSIHSTKEKFEQAFAEQKFYNRQTQNEVHKKQILDCLLETKHVRVLDLGTGSGYLAFAIAKAFPESKVWGLDIVEKQLKRNMRKAKEEEINNLQFVSYGGSEFPFEENSFDLVVSRYALHHFPNIQHTFYQIDRVLTEDGAFFLSDPAPNDNDVRGFVDAYMKMKKDGHIKFYTRQEWMQYALDVGMVLQREFETFIRFPKKKETAGEIYEIMSRYDSEILEGYHLEFTEDEIYITERVNNLMFRKDENIV